MKRLLFCLIAAAALAGGGWYALRISGLVSTVSPAALLPRETVFFVHLPDFNRTREQCHHLDLYQLYQEPAVQEFLRRPLTKLPKKEAVSETLQDIERLDPKDAFFALTFVDRNNLRFAGGFHFRGTEHDAEEVISKWRESLLGKNPAAKRETIDYEHHKIETIKVEPFEVASAYSGHWFFAANDLSELKRLLDRADHRSQDRQSTLEADETYRSAAGHMPAGYAALFFLQPKTFAEQLNSLRAAIDSSVSTNERTQLEKIRSICASTRLEDGKIHDVVFVGMPKIEDAKALTRSSLNLATKDTVLYGATLMNIAEKIDILGRAPGITDKLQKIFRTFTDAGIAPDDWKSAFGPEAGFLGDWPQNSHWPALLFALPVTDVSKAGKIVEAMTRVDEDSVWVRTEKEGVRYFAMQSPASLVSVMPTIALSDRIMIGGLSAAAVEEAIKRSRSGTSELSDQQAYKTAVRLIPPPTDLFAYIDTALLYARLDATVRPLVLMAAAFMPGVSEYVDIDKFPAPEVITKHLSPIVSSQRRERDGYVAESIGPMTLNQAGVGLAIFGLGIANDQRERVGLGRWLPALPSASPSETP